MLRWSLIFFIIAILAAIIGFSGLTHEAARIAKVLAVIGLILALGSLLFHHRSRDGRLRN
jgi:uncharacterized membrane protein YtjA (UPF0391 family)